MILFSFLWFTKLSQVHGSCGSLLFLTKYKSNLIVHGFCSPSHYNGGEGGDLIWKFASNFWWQNLFLHLWQDKPIWVELKTNWEVISITVLLHFHYFISLETANTQKSEVFLLRIFSGNVNTSGVVTCWYPPIC